MAIHFGARIPLMRRQAGDGTFFQPTDSPDAVEATLNRENFNLAPGSGDRVRVEPLKGDGRRTLQGIPEADGVYSTLMSYQTPGPVPGSTVKKSQIVLLEVAGQDYFALTGKDKLEKAQGSFLLYDKVR